VASGAHVASRGDTAPADRGARPLSGASALPTAMAALVAAVLSVVLAYAVVAMPLAMLGWLRPLPTFVGTAVVAVVVFVVWSRAVGGLRPRVPPARSAAAAAAATVVVVLAVTAGNAKFSSEHTIVDRDPGVYLVTGAWLAEHGELYFDGLQGPFADADADLVAHGMGFYEGAPGGRLYAQFFHLFPAVLAAGGWIGGEWLMTKTNALVGGVALLAFFTFSARLVRPWFAAAATAALATNFAQVYFTRDSYTEILVQVFLFGGLWALSLARERGGARAGAIAGLMLGGTAMTRVDALFYLVPLLAFLAYDVISARLGPVEDRRRRLRGIVGTVAGTAVTVGLGLLDGVLYARPYLQDLSGQVKMIAAATAAVAVLGALAIAAQRPLTRLLARLHPHRGRLAAAAAVAIVAVGAYGWLLRPLHQEVEQADQVGTSYGNLIAGEQADEGLPVNPARNYAEDSLRRVAMFTGPVALAAGILGTAIASARVLRGHGDRALAFLAVFVATALLYGWRPSISGDLPWAMRRFLPVVIPGVVLLAAVFADALVDLTRARRWLVASARVVAVGTTAAVVAFPVAVLAPLIDARTRTAPLPNVEQLCDALPDDAAVALLSGEQIRQTLPQTLQGLCHVPVGVLPAEVVTPDDLAAFDADWEAAGRPLYIVSERPSPVPGLEPSATVVFHNQQLERTLERRPEETLVGPQTLHVIPVD